MTSPQAARAVEALLDEASAAYREGRYALALPAAEGAVRAAERLDDPALLVRALVAHAGPLRMRDDAAAALARYTRVLAIAEDPTNAERLANEDAARAVASSYVCWVDIAQFTTRMPWPELFGVLDEAERWLTATGHRHWHAGVLLQRAVLHHRLGDLDAALDAAQEALEAYHPGVPGFSLSGYRYVLGDILCDAGRPGEARPHYEAILGDQAARAYEQNIAHRGLARCAQNDGDLDAARRHAIAAVRLAEPHDDDGLCFALEELVWVHRAAGDLDAAWQEAGRRLAAADRIGGHHRPYFAVRDAVDVALDRGDLESARRLMADLDRHAPAMDTARGDTVFTVAAAQRHERLAELERLAERGGPVT